MGTNIFNPGDKVVYINPKPYAPGNPYHIVIPYIIINYDPIGRVYQVASPNNAMLRFFIQLDAETRFRLATQQEVEQYFG